MAVLAYNYAATEYTEGTERYQYYSLRSLCALW